MRNLAIAASVAIALCVSSAVPGPATAGTKSPVVVELYTSQGCSSCPPAEAFLGELADRPNLITLELHVDYWDYIGWKDPFGAREHGDRQRGYGDSFGERYVYTPQMVIDGRAHEVGSNRDAVEKKLEAALNASAAGPRVTLTRIGDNVRVRVSGEPTSGVYDIFFVTFDAMHKTKIPRGENRGRTLVNKNIVRVLDHVGQWSGKPVELMVSIAGKKGDGGCAVIVQKSDFGPIVGAAVLAFEGS